MNVFIVSAKEKVLVIERVVEEKSVELFKLGEKEKTTTTVMPGSLLISDIDNNYCEVCLPLEIKGFAISGDLIASPSENVRHFKLEIPPILIATLQKPKIVSYFQNPKKIEKRLFREGTQLTILGEDIAGNFVYRLTGDSLVDYDLISKTHIPEDLISLELKKSIQSMADWKNKIKTGETIFD